MTEYHDYFSESRLANILSSEPRHVARGNAARARMWLASGEYGITHPSSFCPECGGMVYIRRDEMASMSVHFGDCVNLRFHIMLRCGHHVDYERPVPAFDPFLNGSPQFWTRDCFYCSKCVADFSKQASRVFGREFA